MAVPLTTIAEAQRPARGFLPFRLLDVPRNIVASGIRFVQTGELDYLKNIGRELIPGMEANRISGQELIDSDNFWAGLAVEVITDPIMIVNQLGALTKAGKAAHRALDLSAAAKIARQEGKVEDFVKYREALKMALGQAKAGRGQAKRSIITLGLPFTKGKQYGDLSKLHPAALQKKALSTVADYLPHTLKEAATRNIPIGFLPDIRKPKLVERAAQLEAEISMATERGSITKANKLGEQLNAVNETLLGMKPSLMPDNVADILRKQGKGLRQKFKSDPESRYLRANEEARSIAQGEALHTLKYGTEPALIRAFEAAYRDVKKVEDISEAVYAKRVLERMEGASWLPREAALAGPDGGTMVGSKTAFPDIDLLADFEAHKHAGRLKKALKKATTEEDKAKVLANYDDIFKDTKLRYEIKRTRMDKLREIQGPLIDSELILHNMMTSMMEGLVKNAQNQRIFIHGYRDVFLEYTTRMLTPQARRLKGTDKKRYSYLHNVAKQRLGNALKRQLYPELAIGEINTALKKHHGLKFDFFETDPIKAVVDRKRQDIINVHKAAAANRIVEAYGRTGVDGVAVWDKANPEKSFLGQVGLTGEAIGDLKEIPKGLKIPGEIRDQAIRTDRLMQESIFNDKGLMKVMSYLDWFNKPFRILFTAPHQAHHNRNFISNTVLTSMDDIRNLKELPGSAVSLHKLRLYELGKYVPTPAELAEFKSWSAYNLTSRGMFADLFRDVSEETSKQFFTSKIPYDWDRPITGTIDEVLKRMGKEPAFKGTRAEQIATIAGGILPVPFTVGRAYGNFMENVARIAHFRGNIKRGASPVEAMRSVNKYLFDYTKLTTFEQQVMRPTFLFYTWLRKNIPLQINTVIENPRLLAMYGKMTQFGTEAVPDYLRASSAFPAGGVSVGSLGIPIEDWNIFNTQDVDDQVLPKIKRQIQKIISATSPALRVPYEVATGETAYSRRPLRELDFRFVSDLFPTSRFFKTASKILDPDTTLGWRYLDAITGMRVYPHSITRAELDEAKRAFMATGKAYRSGFLTLTKEKFKGQPDVEAHRKKIRDLNNRLQRERKRR